MSSAFRTALIGLAAAGALLPMPASAQFKNQGYLADTQGNVVRAPRCRRLRADQRLDACPRHL